jgi:hypothetical protein
VITEIRPTPRFAGLSPRLVQAVHYGTLTIIILVGAWLRLTGLRQQSLWFDEIDVVVRAQRPLGVVASTLTTAGENGPLYNILLALWIRIAGISEVAVRFPSAVAGLLAIPLLYLLARKLAGPTTGLVAAGLLAISPYHVWYSQEAKMYSLVVLLALASTFALVRGLEGGGRWWWVAYIGVTTLLFYTHVVSVLVFVGQGLFMAVTWRRWASSRRGWLVSAAFLTLPYLPIALWALIVVSGRAETWQPDLDFGEVLQVIGVKFAVNRTELEIETRGALLFLALALVGLVALARRATVWAVLLASLTLVPIVGIYVVSLRNSVFSDRYVIAALPFYLLLVAVGVVWLIRSRWLWPVGVAVLFLVTAYAWVPLRDVNRSELAQKEDWRSAWADLADRAEPGDPVLVYPGYIETTYEYFAQRDPRLQGHPVVTIPSFKVQWLTEPLMIQMISEQIGDSRRLWVVESPDRAPGEDPDQVLRGWLEETGTLLYDDLVNGVRISLYELPPNWRAWQD